MSPVLDREDRLFREAAEILEAGKRELAKRIVGQQEMVEGLLMALIAGGHILLEGVPGLAKTLAVKSLADITGLSFKRIQFTPDLLPADLTGTLVWEQGSGTFSVRRGPVFAQVILADEINRAPAKVQSALLEAMEEGQVTIGETSYPLPEPFLVLATQNPIEQEGTYALPEAELDRFLLKLLIRYPSTEEEIQILKMTASAKAWSLKTGEHGPSVQPVLDSVALAQLRAAADAVFMDEQMIAYLVSLVAASRPGASIPATPAPKTPPYRTAPGKVSAEGMEKALREDLYRYIAFGASPRASIALYRCSRIRALFAGRSFVSPEDVKAAALPVLRHRIVLSYEAEAEGLDRDAIIARLLTLAPVP
ncbi:MAG: AAA family ATPase [Spirochaetaceae bacterium]|jgi:MoxR-like ATPase|nr:AAA family ATPase [Spirochaetaceae bacterium]